MFNYETSSMDELVAHINNTTRQALKQASDRFKLLGKHDVVESYEKVKLWQRLLNLKKGFDGTV